jgi:predicted O-linked N-acetylglucosamine transferase (SPINDLY family)
VFNNIANNYRRQGQYEKALEYYDLALEANPEFVEAMNNRGVALLDMGRAPEAAPLFERAMALRPSYVDPLINLSNLKRDQGQLEEAARLLSVALNLKPDNAYGWNNLGCSLGDQGRVPEAIACYSKALDLIPENFAAYSNLLLNLHYLPEYSPEQIWSAHLEFANRYRGQVAGLQRPHPNTPDPQRRLRIGYVSADFRRHSVAFFLEPILEWHDRNQFELYCYSDVIRPDAYTGRFQQLTGSGWRDIRGFNHERFAEIVRRDQIDILVDTGGHTANGRILSFAAKPAPVQVSWIGYPDTTGLAEMDYRLTDAVSDPPGQTEQWHSERLWRLEDSFLCYRPAPGPPPVTASPVSAGRPFTFGSFNSMAKVNAAVIQAWASILTAAPGTRMIIKNKALSAPEARERFFAAFAGYGIGPERIELMGLVPSLEEHLASYSQIDLALDTYPYHGTTTTCEALFMGVPVVTLAGRAHVSRVGCTLLHLAGLDMFVAGNEGDYVQLAATLAARWPEWIDLRGQLRGRLQQSPLMDEAGFIRKVESAYRSMWNQWCQGR